MRAYIIRRLLLAIPTLFLVTLIIFFMLHLIPGTMLDIMLEKYEFITQGDVDALRHSLGMDLPIMTQYLHWIGDIFLHGNLGFSLFRGAPIVESISVAWPVTFELGLLALIIAQLIALPIGIFSALRQDTWGDYIGRSFAILCIAVPGFWLATLVIVFPSIWWDYMPSIMLIPFTEDPIGNLKMFIIPAIVLGMALCGMTMRMTRTMMLEVLRQDYIRTAWAKGLRERVVIIRHTLKNALIPVITIVGIQIPTLIGGTVIIEQIFQMPGMGRLLIGAVGHRDYVMVSGIMFIFGIAVLLTNLIVDLSYSYLDPRIQYR